MLMSSKFRPDEITMDLHNRECFYMTGYDEIFQTS